MHEIKVSRFCFFLRSALMSPSSEENRQDVFILTNLGQIQVSTVHKFLSEDTWGGIKAFLHQPALLPLTLCSVLSIALSPPHSPPTPQQQLSPWALTGGQGGGSWELQSLKKIWHRVILLLSSASRSPSELLILWLFFFFSLLLLKLKFKWWVLQAKYPFVLFDSNFVMQRVSIEWDYPEQCYYMIWHNSAKWIWISTSDVNSALKPSSIVLLFTGITSSLVSLNGKKTKKSFSVCYKQWQSFSPCPAYSAFIGYQNARDLNEHTPRANVLPLTPKLRPASQSKPKRLAGDSGFARFVYVPDSDSTLGARWPVDPTSCRVETESLLHFVLVCCLLVG